MKNLLLFLSVLIGGSNSFGQEATHIIQPGSIRAEIGDTMEIVELLSNDIPEQEEVDSILLMDRKLPFFSITKDGYPTSYLFGTIHLVPPEYAIEVSEFDWIFTEISQVYLEVANLDQLGKLDIERDPKKDRDFLSYFTIAQQDSIFNYAKEHCNLTKGMIKMSNQHYKPFLIEQMLIMTNSKKKLKSATYSYDIDIAQHARSYGYKVNGLERVKDQLFLLSGQDSLNTNKNVMEMIRNADSTTNPNSKLYSAYFSGDVDAIYQYIVGEFSDTAFRERILDKRNLNWMKKIPKYLKKNPTLIAVGAGHLSGELGLIPLLQKQGFKITPIQP